MWIIDYIRGHLLLWFCVALVAYSGICCIWRTPKRKKLIDELNTDEISRIARREVEKHGNP